MEENQRREKLQAIFQKEGKRLYHLAYRLSGNEADAQDIVQEVFMKVYDKIERFEGRAEIFTYLYRIAFNLWCNMLRKRKKWFSFDPDQLEVYLSSRSNSDFPGNRLQEKQNKVELVRSALEKLAPQERFIVILRDIEEYSYHEISGILKCRPGTVKSRLARAREKLRIILEPYLGKNYE